MTSDHGESGFITVGNLHRRFGETRALSGIDLDIPRGRFFGVFGPDGAGKTTLLQIMAAILDPTEGECRVLGYDSVDQSEAITSRIGYMAQGFTLYEKLTVGENLKFAGQIHGIDTETFRARRRELLDMAELQSFTDRRADRLSGGMRKKLALCTNLLHRPSLLLLDEPSLGVDPYSRKELWRILRTFHEKGMSIVVTSSYMKEADYCEELLFLYEGQVVAQGRPGELRERAEKRVFEITTTSAVNDVERLQDQPGILNVRLQRSLLRVQTDERSNPETLAERVDVESAQVREVEPTLEDVFIRLMLDRTDFYAPVEDLEMSLSLSDQSSGEITINGLTRRFGSFKAVDDVTVKIEQGEIWGLLGPNGAGKTTLIKMLCGLLVPSDGDATVAGVNITHSPRDVRSRIGYMSQSFSLYPDLTPGENLSFFAHAQGLSGSDRDSSIRWARSMVNLRDLEGSLVSEMSGALKQRLALASAVLHRPSILFLDEPTSGVDPIARQRFWQLIRLLSSQDLTVVVTTHHLDEAHFCDQLGLLMQGQLIAKGSVGDLREGVDVDKDASIDEIFLQYIEERKMLNGKGARS